MPVDEYVWVRNPFAVTSDARSHLRLETKIRTTVVEYTRFPFD